MGEVLNIWRLKTLQFEYFKKFQTPTARETLVLAHDVGGGGGGVR
jgi:hypothetical protein